MKLHSLSLRRLRNIPPEGEHVREQWAREEKALFAILTRIREKSLEENP